MRMCVNYRSCGILTLLIMLSAAPAEAIMLSATPAEGIMLSAVPDMVQQPTDVRVKLFDQEEPIAVTITSHVAPIHLYAGDFADEIARLSPGETATLSRASDQLYLNVDDGGIFATSIRIEPATGGQITVAVAEGESTTEPRHFEGRLLISPDDADGQLRLINELNIEDYVAAVVAAEYGFDDLEGAKAMAVIIRTYAKAVLNKYGTEFDHVDHTLSQVYRGTERITPTIRQAVRETTGEVLSYDGKLIEAVYFASSGGHTADNETVWNANALPYLRGKSDPYGSSAPQATWTFRVSRERLLDALSSTYGRVTGFVIDERGEDDRVISIELLKASGRHQTIRGNEFRLFILEHFGDATLRSTLFTADRVDDEYFFEGRGSGHGVGLSQWGAHDLAQRNASYIEILDFYYTDVQLEGPDDLTDALAPAPIPSADPPAPPPAKPARKTGRIGW